MAGTEEGRLVEAARAGDHEAFGRLFDDWFDRVHDLSRRIVKDPGTAGEVAQDAFLTAWTRLDSLQDPDAFGGWLLRIARNASLNRLAKERRSVALDHQTMTTMSDRDAPDHDPLATMDQAARVTLVWDAAAALGERDMSILDLHLRHGLGAPELAEELGTTANNAHQILFTLRKRLGTNVRALVLWRAGRPACDDLRRTLSAAGIAVFDKQAVKVIDRHAEQCDACRRERSEQTAPVALFGAAPVVAAPVLLKAQAASALEAAGVPMGGSTALVPSSRPGDPSDANATGDSDGTPPADRPTGEPEPIGAGPDTSAGAPLRGRRPDLHRRRLLMVTAAALVLVVVVVVAAGGLSDGDGGQVEQVAVGASPQVDGSSAPSGGAAADPAGPTAPAHDGSDDGGELTVGPAPTPPTTGAPDPVPGSVVAPPGTGDPRSEDPAPTAPPADRPDAPPATGTAPESTPTTASTTTSTTSTTSITADDPVRPEIVRFAAVSDGNQCRGGLLYDVTWGTAGATTVLITTSSGTSHLGRPTGSVGFCEPVGSTAPTFLMVARGPGGEVERVITGETTGR